MSDHAEVVESWEMLKRRVNIAYYIGEARKQILDDYIYNGHTPDHGHTIGIDLDNDGEVDVHLDVKPSPEQPEPTAKGRGSK